MDADDVQMLADIEMAGPAGIALPAVHVRLHAAVIAGLNIQAFGYICGSRCFLTVRYSTLAVAVPFEIIGKFF